jgi:hypothetical protein
MLYSVFRYNIKQNLKVYNYEKNRSNYQENEI